ncbi:hypothetical protein SVIOM74S_09378 [Streptomyces violarus]
MTKVNTLMFLMAPVTAVWGALAFGEPFGVQTALGLAVCLVAVVVVHRGGGRKDTAVTAARGEPGKTGGPGPPGPPNVSRMSSPEASRVRPPALRWLLVMPGR